MQHQDNKFSGHVIFWKLNPSSSEQVLRGVTRKLWRGFFFSLATFCALTIAPGCYRITLYAFYWKLRSAHFSVAPCIMSRHDQVGLSSQTKLLHWKKHLKTLGHSSCCWDCFIQRFHRLHGGYWCRFTRVQRLINTDVWFLEILEEVTRETRELISFHLRNIWPDLWEFSLKLAFFFLQRGRKTSLFSLSPDVEHLFVKL